MTMLIDTLLERVQKEFAQSEVVWEGSSVDATDLKFLEEECNKDSEFDPLNKRKRMFNEMVNGTMYTLVSKCNYGQLFAVFDSMDQIAELPWELWGRIFRLFSEPHRKPFKVFFLASKSLREFPPPNEPISPENINGGYTYRCDPETIVIYRAEDATRVLIHELQHSCCLDRPENGVDIIEAETEAWAELIYIGVLSQGKKYMFNDLLKRQSEWIIKQNKKVRKHMKDPKSREFPWRYTIGKEEVWERWGILKKDILQPPIKVGNSLRLTFPPNDILKTRFKVVISSTIL